MLLFAVFYAAKLVGQPSSIILKWGSHGGYNASPSISSPIAWGPTATVPGSIQKLYGLNADGTVASGGLENTSAGNSYDGDLIEIGFFNKNTNAWSSPPADSDFDPNADSSNLFQGVWTALTSTTTVGRDWSNKTVGAGEFYFNTNFQGSNDYSQTNGSSNPLDQDDLSDSFDELTEMREALDAASSPYLGIRFYDISTTGGTGGTTKSSGTTRYNTIMNPNWVWDAGVTENLILHLSDGSLDTNLKFEFDVGDYNAVSKVGTADTAVNAGNATHNEFVSAVTYHDGTSALDASGASHILSGLDGSGKITIGGDHTLTLHANSGADRSFAGDIEGSTADSSAATTLVKTGSGKQILTGDVRLAGANAGWINVDEGTLSLSGASSKVFTAEYLTGSGGTLELNNSTINQIELGFANTSASKSFDGNLSMVGSGTEVVIKVASGTTSTDYGKEQNISGVVSGAEKLVKDGVGRLVLEKDNTNTGGVKISNGTLAVGNSANDADTGSGTIEIEKGKLEVLAGDSISNSIQATSASDKSMVGGDGTISTLTIGGDTAEITVVSPGQGVSTSLTNETTTQQTTLGTGGSAALAMGDFTITNLTFNDGGVYDWEISDFSESGVAGTDYDVLKFNSLTFDNSGTFTINILGVQADGSGGAVAGSDGTHSAGLQNLLDDSWNGANKSGSYKGFKFLDGTSHSNITWGGVTSGGATPTSSGGYIDNFFTIDQRGFAYHNNFWMSDWNVWYDGSGDFYLQFSAVPEPSTYMMVTGLLMVPGVSYVRRLRKKNAENNVHGTPAP